MDLFTLATRLMKWDANIEATQRRRLDRAGRMVVGEINEAIGTYKYGWPPLSPATIARKKNGDTPLLETGKLRDSYGHNVVDRESVDVGSNDPRATWFEQGTPRMPPRPVLGPAAIAKEKAVVAVLESDVIKQLEIKP